MGARWMAGNLFALTVYLFYLAMLTAVHGSIAGLQGLGASAQISWFECVHNISVGTGLMLIFLGGLAGALVMANIVMLLYVVVRNYKIVAAVGMLIVWLLDKPTYSQVRLLNPIRFGGSECVTSFLLVGNMIVPYIVIVYCLGIVYVAVLGLAMRPACKKYCIH